MSQIRDVELKIAYQANCLSGTSGEANKYVNLWFAVEIMREHLIAIDIDSKYVVSAKFDGGTFYLFSSMDKARIGAPNAKSYEWVLVDEALSNA